jgi:HTH-type transcriptional regulator / antitoxin HigA
MKAQAPYKPDFAIAPGEILAEHLEAHGLSKVAFARACDRTEKSVHELLAGKAPVTAELAIRIGRILDTSPQLWLALEQQYRLALSQLADQKELASRLAWVKEFPIAALQRLKVLPGGRVTAIHAEALLHFFGVGSIGAWEASYEHTEARFRASSAFRLNAKAVATWLRLGELAAVEATNQGYDEAAFGEVLKEVRDLTRMPPAEAIAEVRQLCAKVGVAVVQQPELPGMHLSGAAGFLSHAKHQGMILLSGRYRTMDQWWFTFFHEAAHLILHGRKHLHLDTAMTDGIPPSREELEADCWAEDRLLARNEWDSFVRQGDFSRSAILQLAAAQNLCPGIILGRLQRGKLVRWAHRDNELKMALPAAPAPDPVAP